jgi:hypothetical protein
MGVVVSEITIETSNGHRERHREFAEQPAHDAAHQQQGMKTAISEMLMVSTVNPISLRSLQRRLERSMPCSR